MSQGRQTVSLLSLYKVINIWAWCANLKRGCSPENIWPAISLIHCVFTGAARDAYDDDEGEQNWHSPPPGTQIIDSSRIRTRPGCFLSERPRYDWWRPFSGGGKHRRWLRVTLACEIEITLSELGCEMRERDPASRFDGRRICGLLPCKLRSTWKRRVLSASRGRKKERKAGCWQECIIHSDVLNAKL